MYANMKKKGKKEAGIIEIIKLVHVRNTYMICMFLFVKVKEKNKGEQALSLFLVSLSIGEYCLKYMKYLFRKHHIIQCKKTYISAHPIL